MIRLIAIILCALLAGSAVVGTLISIAYAEEENALSTKLDIVFDETHLGLRVRQETEFLNDTGEKITSVIFSLPANAYRFLDAQTGTLTPGGVDFFQVEADGEPARWAVSGTKETVLRVEKALENGEKAVFAFGYDVVLPSGAGFLGSGEMGVRLSFFYPEPAYYNEATGAFEPVQVSDWGDFYRAKPRDFDISIEHDARYLVVSGGAQTTTAPQGGRALTTITLKNVRDAALCVSRMYTRYERETAKGAILTAYTNTRAGAKRALDAAGGMADFLTEKLGACPFESLAIVQTDVEQSASHPGLIFLPGDLFALSSRAALERETAFAVAKAWFGVSLQSDPAREPWMSASLCRYLALRYYAWKYDQARFAKELNGNSLDALRVTLPGNLQVDSALSDFQTQSEYDTVIYGRGAAALHEICVSLGEDTFFEAIRLYYAKNSGGEGGIAAFAAALNEATGREMDNLLMESLRNMGDYAGQGLEVYS